MNKPTVVITHHALSRKDHTVKDVDNWHRERWPGSQLLWSNDCRIRLN